jgi:sortase A
MSKFEHNHPNQRGGRGPGELLILLGILFLGLALMVLMGAAGSTQDAGAMTEAPELTETTPVTAPAPATQSPVPVASVTATPTATSTRTSATAPVATSPAQAPVTAVPRPAPTPKPALPGATHITISSVGIDTNVVDVGYQIVTIDGQSVRQLQVADYAAGHDALSANPGEGGNIVISGHDDWKGEVFKNLHNVKLGDQVLLTTPAATHRYVITEIIYRKDVGVPLADRLAAGQYLAPMPEERVTLVTCWPYGVDTHRLIVVAKPA